MEQSNKLIRKKKHNYVFSIAHAVKEQWLKFFHWKSKLEALLWCNEVVLEIERIIEMQDVIHWNNFFEHWNKQHTDFKQSSTDNLSPGNGVVRSPGNKVITFVLILDCASSRMTSVKRLHDYKDGRLREWRKCSFIVLSSLARKENLWWKFWISGEYLWNRESGRLLLKSGGLEYLTM